MMVGERQHRATDHGGNSDWQGNPQSTQTHVASLTTRIPSPPRVRAVPLVGDSTGPGPGCARAALGVVAATAVATAVVCRSCRDRRAGREAFPEVGHGPSLKLKVFASAPTGYGNPDDLTRLGGVLYVAFQNNAAADGTPVGGMSGIVGYALRTGKLVRHPRTAAGFVKRALRASAPAPSSAASQPRRPAICPTIRH
jgi:hypothetical protein